MDTSFALVCAFVTALSLVSCGGGDQGLEDVLARTSAHYQVLDLQTGELEGRGAVDDLLADGRAFDRYLVFRLVDAASAQLGASSNQLGSGYDASAQQANQQAYYIAVCELTRNHWQRLHGSQPWTTIDPVTLAGDLADGRLPVCGLSFALASDALAAASTGQTWSLALPSARQWQHACAQGRSFVWGELADVDLAFSYAVSAESVVDGPQPVAELSANNFGLFDVHGNCWEFDNAGNLHGGSWRDPVMLSRATAVMRIEADSAHALAGLRPVLRPLGD